MALVKGIGPELLYQGEGEVPPLIRFITVHGDLNPGDHYRRVNINTAPREVLMALDQQMNESFVEEVIAWRAEGAFENPTQIKDDVPGFPGDNDYYSEHLGPLIDVKSSHFSARITGETASASSQSYGVFKRTGNSVKLVYYKGF